MGLWVAKKGRKRQRVPQLVGAAEDSYDPLTFGL